MKSVIIIPARLDAQRLPRKPLALINGKPMVIHVLERAQKAQMGDVVVACCGEEIARVVKEAGGKAIITDAHLPSGTDRVKAALDIMEQDGLFYEYIVNLQGDLPTISPDSLKKVIEALKTETNFDIMTLVAPMSPENPAVYEPNCVKAVLGQMNRLAARALYFSRSVVPYNSSIYYHHIGVYAFRKSALERFVKASPCELELCERLEQLRALDMGMAIGAAIVNEVPVSVDVPEDLDRACVQIHQKA